MSEIWQRLNLRTCDQIICSGTAKLSKRIKWFNRLIGVKGEAAEITHTATIQTQCEIPVVVESTTLNKWVGKEGVQRNILADWLPNYPGRVWVRRLIVERNQIFEYRFQHFYDDNEDKDYESGIPGALELLFAGLRRNIASNLKNVHCSELGIYGLQEMGLFDPQMLANNFPPYTFAENGDVEKHLIGCSLGPMILIKDKKAA